MSRSEVAAEGMTLEPGQQVRIVCPFCGGGSTRERCMSLRMDEQTGLLFYHCFRANCSDGSGAIGNTGSLLRKRPERPQFEPYDATILTRKYLPDGVHAQLYEWGLSMEDPDLAAWAYDRARDRIAMPVFGPMGELRGYVLRAYRETKMRGPKVLNALMVDDQPFQAWIHGRAAATKQSIVCVEDIPSAVRVSRYGYQALALLGCVPSDAALDEIGRTARRMGKTVTFALDADATATALQLVRRYGMRGSADVLVLNKDFKNMSETEVIGCLKSVP